MQHTLVFTLENMPVQFCIISIAQCYIVALLPSGHWGTCPSTSNNFMFSSLWSKSESQLSNYFVVCKISWCRCQQLTALSISTALVTKLLVIEQLLHAALKSTVSAPWHNFNLCPSSQQILATPLHVVFDCSQVTPYVSQYKVPCKLTTCSPSFSSPPNSNMSFCSPALSSPATSAIPRGYARPTVRVMTVTPGFSLTHVTQAIIQGPKRASQEK